MIHSDSRTFLPMPERLDRPLDLSALGIYARTAGRAARAMAHGATPPGAGAIAQPRASAMCCQETTVNRIAAGEVIERPAAAVKELVENALDAGARRISVVLAAGGIDRIEVTDDGSGMTAEELGLCVLRHATSKLADDNLIRIDTLGFRGEALPSIGAAARLEITSRTREARILAKWNTTRPAGHAWSITVEGRRGVGLVEPAAGAPGTRIVVRDLFFATPARRKFLKNPRTEAEHAEAAVRRLAMAAPACAFRLENEGPRSSSICRRRNARAERVAALLGAEAAGWRCCRFAGKRRGLQGEDDEPSGRDPPAVRSRT